jgi:iron complex transport system permease protein
VSSETSTGEVPAARSDRSRIGWLFDPNLVVLALGSLVVLFGAAVVQVSHGAFPMTYGEAWSAIFNPDVIFDLQAWDSFLFGGEFPDSISRESNIVWNIRMPRVFVAIFVGMNLAISGAIFQAVTRNELASPFILGVSSGAGLAILLTLVVLPGITLTLPFVLPQFSFTLAGLLPLVSTLGVVAALVGGCLYAYREGVPRNYLLAAAGTTVVAFVAALALFPGATQGVPFVYARLILSLSALLPLLAALGGIVAFFIVYAIAWKNGTSPVRLVLAGVVVGTVFTSLQKALFFFADDIGVVQTAIQWTTGSLTGVGWEEVRIVLPWSVFAIVLAIAGARQLNVLLLGEQTARSLGMSIEKVRFALSAVAVLAAAASIAVAGIVSFVGLIVPHVVRNLVGSDNKKLIVGCLFVGPALMVVADVGARLGMSALVGADIQVPVGIVTGLIGGPYFLYLMRKQDNIGEI